MAIGRGGHWTRWGAQVICAWEGLVTAHPKILHLPTTQALAIRAACSGRTMSVGHGHGLHRTHLVGLSASRSASCTVSKAHTGNSLRSTCMGNKQKGNSLPHSLRSVQVWLWKDLLYLATHDLTNFRWRMYSRV